MSSITRAPSRCASCPTHVITKKWGTRWDDSEKPRYIRTWNSFDELCESADNGCDFCTLIRQYLVHCETIEKMQKSAGVIKLCSYCGSWSVECSAFHGAISCQFLTLENLLETSNQTTRRDVSDPVGQAADWLHTCLTRHHDCWPRPRRIPRRGEYPKRLIDLSHQGFVEVFNCEDRVMARKMPRRGCEYCTLSYRWGDTPHSCVLREPFDGELIVDIASMPRTFQDAVTVVKRLGFRYLWIDALCIVQPSPGNDEEWLAEGSRMGVIYQNAVCTIAATAALHANQGFLQRTGSSSFAAQPVVVRKTEDGVESDAYIPIMAPRFYESISHSALNRRGWVIQERALSTRTIHFTVHGAFWECGSCKAHDAYGLLQDRDDFPSCRSRETLLQITRTRRIRHLCPVEWFHFIKYYSAAEFTNPSDRLLALSSVAKAVQPYLGGHDYIAGLWKNDIVRGLAWKSWPKLRSDDPTTPSWSWAAAKGRIDLGVFSLRSYRYDLVEVLETSATPLSESNPFGGLERGSITLLGILCCEYLVRYKELPYDYDYNVYWDDPPEAAPETNRCKPYSILPIARQKEIMIDKYHIGGLILEPTGHADVVSTDTGERLRSEFRRVGWIEYTYRSGGKRSYWEERDSEEIILI